MAATVQRIARTPMIEYPPTPRRRKPNSSNCGSYGKPAPPRRSGKNTKKLATILPPPYGQSRPKIRKHTRVFKNIVQSLQEAQPYSNPQARLHPSEPPKSLPSTIDQEPSPDDHQSTVPTIKSKCSTLSPTNCNATTQTDASGPFSIKETLVKSGNPPLSASRNPFKKQTNSIEHLICDDCREEIEHLRRSLQGAKAQMRKDACTISIQTSMLANYKEALDGVESDLTEIFSGEMPLD